MLSKMLFGSEMLFFIGSLFDMHPFHLRAHKYFKIK